MRRRNVLIALVGFGIAYLPASVAHGGVIGLDQRIAAQRAIEQVYWNHRIWPDQNPAPKPALDAVMPAAVIIDRAEDALRKSAALEKWWSRPVEAGQLQAELDRIARDSKDPGMLREIFVALGDDPELIAECLVRPLLADRLIRNWYAWDDRFHAGTRARAERDIAAAESVGFAALRSKATRATEHVLRLDHGDAGNPKRDGPEALGRPERFVSASTLAEARTNLSVRVPQLEENDASFYLDRVIADSGDTITIERVIWAKRPFDDWWDDERATHVSVVQVSAAHYSLPDLSASSCTPDSWTPTKWGAPTSRVSQVAIWTGTEMIVWGGNDGLGFLVETVTGGRYNPATDSWLPTRIDGTEPWARTDFSVVWTGIEMIVWGGRSQNAGLLDTGARYNPQTDAWVATGTSGSIPEAHIYHTAVWTGNEMIIWGGSCFTIPCNTGARYAPATDTWQTVTVAGAPGERAWHTAVWLAGRMVVWGGLEASAMNTGSRYDPLTDSWQSTSTSGAVPQRRFRHTAVVAGSEMIVWGGEDAGFPLATGGRYNPVTDSWTAVGTGPGTPAARKDHTAVWTGTQMIIVGGGLTSGGRYNPVTDAWTATSTVNAPMGGSGVWTGTEMLVWGGWGTTRSGYGARYRPSNNTWTPMASSVGLPVGGPALGAVWTGTEMVVTGISASRYNPATNSWQPAATTGAPSIRIGHFNVWTGTEVLVWGGFPETRTGSRYNPSTNAWTTIPVVASTPTARFSGSEAWTGKEMIVWGGVSQSAGYFNTGARYDPQTGVWSGMSTGAGVPAPRSDAATAWTGSRLLIWGGDAGQSTYFADGSRYDPQTDTWTPMSGAGPVPSARSRMSAVWTGNEFIPWGGESSGPIPEHNDGARYDPVLDSWTPLAEVNQPAAARGYHIGRWTGTEMIVWGGRSHAQAQVGATGGRYELATGVWSPTSIASGTPPASQNLVAAWTGTQLIVWGGNYDAGSGEESHNTGGAYCPGTCVSPGAVTDLKVVKKTGVTNGVLLSWDPASGANSYDVQAGPLLALRNSGGNFTTSTSRCIAQNTPATSEADAIPSQPGDGTWYLVRARNCSGGTFDLGTSQQGSRDAEIAAAAAACK